MKESRQLAILPGPSFVPTSITLPQPARFHYVLTINTKPEAAQQYEDSVRKIVYAANKTANVQPWVAFQVATGGVGGAYIYVLSFNRWEERDSWLTVQQILSRAYGKDEGSKLLQIAVAATSSSQTTLARLLPEFSSELHTFSSVARYYWIGCTEVKPEKLADYELFLSKIKAAWDKNSDPPGRVVRRIEEGPSRFTFVTARPFNKYTEKDTWLNIKELMGISYGEEETRQLLEMYLQTVKKREVFEIIHRPDLSR